MIASLGMYDLPPLQDANDRFWAAIRDGLRARSLDAPDRLTRGEAAFWSAWQSPDLVLSQTCGYPYRSVLHGKVALVGTPDFGVEGCPPGYYRSVFVARISDPHNDLAAFSGSRFAYNENLSQSGWAAAQNHATQNGLSIQPALRTGGHRNSALAVAEGRADLAAIDAVTWTLLKRHDDVSLHLKVVGQTEPTPGLPYITRLGSDAEAMFLSVSAAIDALTPQDRDLLQLKALVRIPAEDYLSVPIPPAPDAVRASV